MDLNNCGSKLFVYMRFFLSGSLWNYCHTMVFTGVRMKPSKSIKYVLVECNLFLKYPRQMKGCIVIIYIQEHITGSDKIIKYQIFLWILLMIHKLMSSYIIGFMFIIQYHYTTYALKQSISIMKKYFTLINLWSKVFPLNISYPSTFNQIGGYLDTRISPTYLKYILSQDTIN